MRVCFRVGCGGGSCALPRCASACFWVGSGSVPPGGSAVLPGCFRAGVSAVRKHASGCMHANMPAYVTITGYGQLYFAKFLSAFSSFSGHEASLARAFPARTAARIATMSFFDQKPQLLAKNRGLKSKFWPLDAHLLLTARPYPPSTVFRRLPITSRAFRSS